MRKAKEVQTWYKHLKLKKKKTVEHKCWSGQGKFYGKGRRERA